MIVSDVKTQFYDELHGCRVLLLVGTDVDALCATRILQYLFQCDNILYTMVSVNSKSNLHEEFRKYKDLAKRIVLINCGSSVDVVNLLHPDEDAIFFICDAHRPVDVYNVYSRSEVRVMLKEDEIEGLPHYEDIFIESDDDNSDMEATDRPVIERRNKRLREEKRRKILFEYSQFSYYGLSSALLMFDLAWSLSKDNTEILWWAIVGLADQYFHGKIDHERYALSATLLQNHVTRHSHRCSGSIDSDASCMRLSYEKELNLVLYRHWSLFESLVHTRYTACKFKLWTFKGLKKLQEFLAEIGVPLPQCKQKYSAMDTMYRSNICTWMEDVSEKYKLEKIIYGSFCSQFGYKGKFSAMDVVAAVNAIVESSGKVSAYVDNFLCALDALGKDKVVLLQHGIELAKSQFISVFQQVQTLIDTRRIICAGPFLYSVIEEGTPDIMHFCHPSCLLLLAHFLLEAHAYTSRSLKSRSLPLVLMALDASKTGHYLVVGIPPLSGDSSRNFFGKAFEQAASHSNVAYNHDLFDSFFIYVSKKDKSKFFDALISVLS